MKLQESGEYLKNIKQLIGGEFKFQVEISSDNVLVNSKIFKISNAYDNEMAGTSSAATFTCFSASNSMQLVNQLKLKTNITHNLLYHIIKLLVYFYIFPNVVELSKVEDNPIIAKSVSKKQKTVYFIYIVCSSKLLYKFSTM